MLTLQATGTIQGVCGTSSALTYTIFGMELSAGVESYKVLAQGVVPNSAGVFYTVPGSTIALVKRIQIANTTSSQVSGLILYVDGDASGNQITGSITIPANGSMVWTSLGSTIYDGNGIIFTGAGFSTPAVTLGTAASGGTAATTIRSDSTIAAFDTTIPSTTTPLAFGIPGSVAFAARRDHTHQSPGGIASITSSSSGINTADTSIINATIPASLMQAGTTFRLKIIGTCTSSAANTSTIVIRIGTAGTNSDAAIVTLTVTAATSGTNIPFEIEGWVTVRSAGTSVTAEGFLILVNSTTTGISTATLQTSQFSVNSNTVNTTVQNIIALWYKSSVSTTTSTFQIAEIEIVKM